MKFYIRFAIVWAVNSILILLASALYPANFVLGTANISPLGGAILSGFILTAFCRLAKAFLTKVGLKVEGRYKKFLKYWLVNSVGIWLIARMAPITGLGISAFYWAFALGFVASLVQWLLRQLFKATSLLNK
ncbi:hypothetical protein HY405_00550 [Candidatus Microgenomates bacterium]|nr:hypothetical protein [Candidatus Microgenomates bacterium]